MGALYSIGELLIDFIPLEKGKALKDVTSFERSPGGAPANVAAAVAKFGGKSSMITKLGEDAFGDFLLEKLEDAGVKVDKIKRTREANTGLAFVSLKDDGERDFSFYRNPSSDLLLTEEEIDEAWFTNGDILHFCSVDLVESPMKLAHRKAIKAITENGGLVSFDPNIRLPLWEDPEECKKTVREFLPLAHIVKVSDEELEFITGIQDVEEAIQSLFAGNVQVVIFTKGGSGADLYIEKKKYESRGFKVDVQDTTGAGDAFIGAFLYQLLQRNADVTSLQNVIESSHTSILAFANASGALTTTGKGAISSLPSIEDIQRLIRE
ncbi:carbohydrate kinase family protein [Peribacillus kribbensis]|uniref:carbohydrate kinase family protein n=1 Tax=Peribacillus kribbensis TaxID=356658 RepID=UPI00047A3B26|nr:carbohydrate kinase [Peribacillus kribbensis]